MSNGWSYFDRPVPDRPEVSIELPLPIYIYMETGLRLAGAFLVAFRRTLLIFALCLALPSWLILCLLELLISSTKFTAQKSSFQGLRELPFYSGKPQFNSCFVT
jgi:hypothetical protein